MRLYNKTEELILGFIHFLLILSFLLLKLV